MIVEFRASDRPLALKALSIYRKAIEAAVAACDKVYVPTVELQTADARAESSRDWVMERLDDMEPGEERALTMPSDFALALRTASSCYLTQLGKLAEKQSDLLVPLEDTNALTSQLQSLADRLSGQTELSGVTTTMKMSFGGVETGSRELTQTLQMETPMGFIDRELTRIEAGLYGAERETGRWRELFAAQQALKWATEPQGFAAPFDMIQGRSGPASPDIPAGTADCSPSSGRDV